MRRIVLTLIATLVPLATSAASKDGHLGIAQFMFKGDKAFGCVNPNGDPIDCKITEDTTFKIFRSPDNKHALVFVTYLPDATGNAVQSAAILTEEVETGWGVKRQLISVGQAPSSIKFTAKNVTFVSKVARPSDSRINPTGRKTFSLAY
ncbi:hypothetical protein [Methylobacterium sp. 13MFTsu3.1M2]|uniref:hypothetical protein n=1 Tax=Methylobacterium sp. 13MFTsu3.1M2 TaxID=1502776 RepID=UPI0008EB9A67|nr:hypothetical protein [Methylobacterium sp. 13MFTsu3.1M2]SFE09973.1 hypothetical protein SAMN02799627_02556 [Methylobacterium sp. 13MFTsu3.1M2]